MGQFLAQLPEVAKLRVVVRLPDRVTFQLLIARPDIMACVWRPVIMNRDQLGGAWRILQVTACLHWTEIDFLAVNLLIVGRRNHGFLVLDLYINKLERLAYEIA